MKQKPPLCTPRKPVKYTQKSLESMSKRKTCCNAQCDEVEERRFIDITMDTMAGQRDWAQFSGESMCYSCYARYLKRGTLERVRNRSLQPDEMCCSYVNCGSPEKSSKFFQITNSTIAGGQDWSSLKGSVLCLNCWCSFKRRGTLERYMNKPLAASARCCTYSGCLNPSNSRQFLQISSGKNTRGWDWSSITGSVLCNTCYTRFVRTGTLEKTIKRGIKRKRRSPVLKDALPSESRN
jgi:hypothetical protein